jgi:DNA-binding IclR family transcriptional regulator
MSEEKNADSVRAVDRALDILLAFEPGDRHLGASDLLKRVPLSRPTLYRLLHTLEQRGFVVASGEPQRFALGPAVAQLAHVWTAGLDLPGLAQPMMQQLWNETGETVALMVHSGPARVCVAELPSPQPLSFKRGVGHSERVTVGASGRVIIAFVDDPSSYVQDMSTRKRATYLAELEQIRRLGYAVSREELIKGAVAIAVPVFGAGNKVVGSLAVYGPSVRIDDHQINAIAKMLLRQAQRISQKAGAG